MAKIIDKGAEATISLDNHTITKTREEKLYRLKQIDDELRKFRTRRESKVLTKLQEIYLWYFRDRYNMVYYHTPI